MPAISGDIAVEGIVVTALMLLLQRYWMLKKIKAVCGSYSTAALRHIVLLPE